MSDFPRFMIAAAHKSSGKTVVSTGLAAALSGQGNDLQAFKKGPDYIDPMWLAAASGKPCYNIDFNSMERDTITPFFASRAGALSLVEANKGLFDGVDPEGADSNAELAKLLKLPVVLVIDTQGMTRGIAPLLVGYTAFDPEVNIAGVILNQVGGSRHEGKLRQAVEAYTDIPVIGSVWRNPRLEIGERHLGLTTPAESGRLEDLIARLSEVVGNSVDLEQLVALAGAAPSLGTAPLTVSEPGQAGRGLRIGIVRDTAFGFYYPDDLEAFEAAGATLVPIDAIRDENLPDIDGLFIGGGFPEMQLQSLSANKSLRTALGAALSAGLPCYAECGGLMYLCQSLSWNGETGEMVGLIPGRAVMHKRPQGRGYVAFENTPEHPWAAAGERITAHEFHYASIEDLPKDAIYTRRMTRGSGITGGLDGIRVANTVAGFCHLRNTCCSPWVTDFLNFVQGCKVAEARKNPPRRTG